MAEANLVDQIRRRAYDIWVSEGRPHGRDRIHWLRAEAEFLEGSRKSVLSETPPDNRNGGGKRHGKETARKKTKA